MTDRIIPQEHPAALLKRDRDEIRQLQDKIANCEVIARESRAFGHDEIASMYEEAIPRHERRIRRLRGF